MYLKSNRLALLPSGSLKGLINLQDLSLSENQIQKLDPDLFNETRKLRHLFIHRNKLTLLPSGLFKGLINLETLHLSENQIQMLDGDMFNETLKLIICLLMVTS